MRLGHWVRWLGRWWNIFNENILQTPMLAMERSYERSMEDLLAYFHWKYLRWGRHLGHRHINAGEPKKNFVKLFGCFIYILYICIDLRNSEYFFNFNLKKSSVSAWLLAKVAKPFFIYNIQCKTRTGLRLERKIFSLKISCYSSRRTYYGQYDVHIQKIG